MPHTKISDHGWNPDLERQIKSALKDVRYGSVEIIIHDSKVVQIERREKIRLDAETGGSS